MDSPPSDAADSGLPTRSEDPDASMFARKRVVAGPAGPSRAPPPAQNAQPDKESPKKRKKKRSVARTHVSEEDDTYEVEKVLDIRLKDGVKEYKLLWKNYPIEEASWEPSQSLNCLELIEAFESETRANRAFQFSQRRFPGSAAIGIGSHKSMSPSCEGRHVLPSVTDTDQSLSKNENAGSSRKKLPKPGVTARKQILDPSTNRASEEDAAPVATSAPDLPADTEHARATSENRVLGMVSDDLHDQTLATWAALKSVLPTVVMENSEKLNEWNGKEDLEKIAKFCTPYESPEADEKREFEPSRVLRFLTNTYGDPFVEMEWEDGFVCPVSFPAATKLYPRVFLPWLMEYVELQFPEKLTELTQEFRPTPVRPGGKTVCVIELE